MNILNRTKGDPMRQLESSSKLHFTLPVKKKKKKLRRKIKGKMKKVTHETLNPLHVRVQKP